LLALSPWVDPAASSAASKDGFQRWQHIDYLGAGAPFLRLGALGLGQGDKYRSLLSPEAVDSMRQHLPECLVQCGDRECFYDAIAEFASLVNGDEASKRVHLEVFKDQVHCFQNLGELSPYSMQALESAATFLAKFR